MRLNKFIAGASGYSRRRADELIASGRVAVNGQPARVGQPLAEGDVVELDGKRLLPKPPRYLMLHKPAGYVCSRNGQGAPTIYQLLPEQYRTLNCVGRLDKDTSGLIMLSDDGDWAQRLTHPSYNQIKRYEIGLDRPLMETDLRQLLAGVELEDGLSKFDEVKAEAKQVEAVLHGGRNRQIRRTLAALGYEVVKLHRTKFGPYELDGLKSGEFKEVDRKD